MTITAEEEAKLRATWKLGVEERLRAGAKEELAQAQSGVARCEAAVKAAQLELYIFPELDPAYFLLSGLLGDLSEPQFHAALAKLKQSKEDHLDVPVLMRRLAQGGKL